LALKVVQELIRQVSILGEHVIKVSKTHLPQTFLFVDISVHSLALSLNVFHYLFFVCNSCLPLFYKTIIDALQLRSDRCQFIGVVLDTVYLFLIDSCFELVPKKKIKFLTYMRSW